MSRGKPKVLLAMSGGVDSSVAAALLLRDGYDVVGVFMRLGSPGETFDELIEDSPQAGAKAAAATDAPGECSSNSKLRIGHQGCCSINDAADARHVAAKLGIPFYVVNFKKDFGRIIEYFVGEYNAGRTPNPCIRCNDWLKFGRLHDYARQIDADFVASGHYARIEFDQKRDPRNGLPLRLPRLLRGIDHDKDQSYVLFGVPRDRLACMLLPIGGLRKTEVRRMARELDLPVFDKPDSQEICFVPDNDYAGLVRRRTPDAVRPGDLLHSSGRVLGQHRGHQHFTVGQRKGLGVAVGHPLYVIEKDAATNTVTVGEHEELASSGCVADQTNWLIDPPLSMPATFSRSQECENVAARHDRCGDWIDCTAKIRYNAEPVPARVLSSAEDEIEVKFDEPQHAVAPGQAVVCYDNNDAVICGGWISQAT